MAMHGEVLVLNSAYMPINLIKWQEAVCLWITNKAEIISSYEDKLLNTGKTFIKRMEKEWKSSYDDKFETWDSAMNMPSVIRLYEFVHPKKNIKFYKPFTRANLLERDGKKCQYCGKPLTLSKMTFDHIVPKCKNGLTKWENIVCCCLKCNSLKGGRTPEEAGMQLISKPYAPKIADSYAEGMISKLKSIPRIMKNEHWRQFIYFNIQLEEDL